MTNLYQASNPRIQKQFSQYETKSAFAEAIHKLLWTNGLRVPKYVKRFLKWCAAQLEKMPNKSEFGYGAFYHAEKTIAEQMGCSTKTVQRAISWLKAHGLLNTFPSWNSNEDKRGTDYKVFSPLKDIETMAKALINKEKQIVKKLSDTISSDNEIVKKLSDTMSDTMSDCSPEENPVIPRDEATQKEGDSNSFINNLDINNLSNRLSDKNNTPKRNPFQFIKPEIVEIVKMMPWHEEEQIKIARKIQKAFKDANAEINEETIALVYKALGSAIQYIEKKKVLKDSSKKYGYIYQCIKTELNGFLTKHEKVEENGKVIGVIRHEHYHEMQKPKSIATMYKDMYGVDDDDLFPFDEPKEEVRERKVLSDDDVIIHDSKPQEAEITKNSVMAKINTFREMEMHPRKTNNLWT